MSDRENSSQATESARSDVLGYLTNVPLTADPDASEQPQPYANELTTNIIKDATRVASAKAAHQHNGDPTGQDDESNILHTHKRQPSDSTKNALNKSDHSLTNGTHKTDDDFDDEEIQKKMSNVIGEIRSRPSTSGGSAGFARKSLTSGRLLEDPGNVSTPAITDPPTEIDPTSHNLTEGPLRSMSESDLVDHHTPTEQSAPPMVVPQNETSSDGEEFFGIHPAPTNASVAVNDSIDQQGKTSPREENGTAASSDDDFFNTKTATIEDNRRPSSAVQQRGLDETTRFGVNGSPKPKTTSRTPSAASKRSVPVTPDEPSTSGDEKRASVSPSKMPDDGGTDVERDNQEVAEIARRPSVAKSPVERPRSPTPDDSRKRLSDVEQLTPENPVVESQRPQSPFVGEQARSPVRFTSPQLTKDDTNVLIVDRSPPTSAREDEHVSSPRQREEEQQRTASPKPASPTTDTDTRRFKSPSPEIRRQEDEQSKRASRTSNAIVSPTSRRDSTARNEQKQQQQPESSSRRASVVDAKLAGTSSEPSTSRRSSGRYDSFVPTDEQSNLIKPGEQLQIPTHETYNERINSPPPSSTDLEQISQLKRSSIVDKQQPKQDTSRPSSGTNGKSPASSTMSNEKVIDGDILPSKGRRESTVNEQERRVSIVDQKPTTRRESVATELPAPLPSTRRVSIAQQPDESDTHREQQQPPSSRRASQAGQELSSRRESLAVEPSVPVPGSQRTSFAAQESTSRRGSLAVEPSVPLPSSRRASIAQQPDESDTRREQQQQPPSRRSSSAVQESTSRRASVVAEPSAPLPSSQRTSFARQQSDESDTHREQQQPPSSRKASHAAQESTSRRESLAVEPSVPLPSSQRISFARQQSDESDTHREQQQQPPSSRKASYAAAQESPSRRESQQQPSSNRRASINRETEISSPRRYSSVPVAVVPSQSTSRRGSLIIPTEEPLKITSRRSSFATGDFKHQQPSMIESERTATHVPNKEISSSDTDVRRLSSLSQQEERKSPVDKRQKSSSTTNDSEQPQTQFKRRSGQSTRKSFNLNTDETITSPIIMNATKARQQGEGRPSISTQSDNDTSAGTPKLPTVGSASQQRKRADTQEKPRRSGSIHKQQLPVSDRLETKQPSSSHATTPSEDDQAQHWTRQVYIPPIRLSDDETPREDQPRPQSPNVEQIAERNPPSPKTTKKLSATDGQTKKQQQQRASRRSTSAESVNQIPIVDDKSLDSNTSGKDIDFDRQKRRHTKTKKKDVQTNTDRPSIGLQSPLDLAANSNYQRQQHRTFFDEQELTSQKPLKATKPMSDHLHPTRRRAPVKEQETTTPETVLDSDGPVERRITKQFKDTDQNKDPVNVNVTVVVKKFAGTSADGSSHMTAEAHVEQKPHVPSAQQSEKLFEPVQRSSSPPPPVLPENEQIERPKSTEQASAISPPRQLIEYNDRHTQSDTEQIVTEKQKRRRRPKRISRTSQTYECVFRRMDREATQELRATNDNDKNIQTRKSQLRVRKKSPRRNFPLYLSADTFRVEDLLPKQFHQSRRNLSKSSAVARSLSPQGGKLLILRPTLPLHHTDAVSVHRVCLQYAIDLVPNEDMPHGPASSHRNKLTVLKQPQHVSGLPMLSSSSSAVGASTTRQANKSANKEKASTAKSGDIAQHRKNGGV